MQVLKLTDIYNNVFWLLYRNGEIAKPVACLTDNEWQRFMDTAIAQDARILEPEPANSKF